MLVLQCCLCSDYVRADAPGMLWFVMLMEEVCVYVCERSVSTDSSVKMSEFVQFLNIILREAFLGPP